MIDLTPYSSIKSALLVRVHIKKYKTSPSATPIEYIGRFSDSTNDITVYQEGVPEDYQGTGQLIDISSSTSELKTSSNEVTIEIAGVPNTTIATMMNSSMKGSRISIYRILLDPLTNEVLPITGNPMGRFFGMISNMSIDESWDQETNTNTISFVCKSLIEILNTSVKGRRTNPYDEKLYFPADISMDRVPSLKGSNYNFGNIV